MAWWCVVLLLGFVSAPAVESVPRKAPAVYTKQIAPLLTPLERVLARRDAFPDAKTNGIVLLDEVVHYRDAAGIGYVVFHDVFLARNTAAESAMGNRIYSFDREHDSIFLIAAATIGPDGKRQELSERAAFIQSPQREADNGLYTSEQELNLIFPNIAAGAVTESIVLIREDKPVFPGEFAAGHAFALGWPTAQVRYVTDFPSAFHARVHVTKSTEQAPDPQVQTAAGRTRSTWTREHVREINWEDSSPSLRFRAPSIWLTTLDSWDQVAKWFSDLAAPRAELGPELEAKLAEWTKDLDAPRAIVDRLASIVANDVRYTGLEFGLAGYQPYPCERVWAQRYGDCKDKANLLRALLARKGIRSHFLLLTSGGLGRVEKRSPSWKQFNHVIVAVEDGTGGHWFCDTTMRHLPAGHLPIGDAARDALLLHADRGDWLHMPDPLDNTIHVDADLTLSATGGLSGWFTLTAAAGDAASYTESYNQRKPHDRRRALEEIAGTFYPGAEIIDIAYEPAEGSVKDFKIRGYLLRKPAAATGLDTLPFGYPSSWLPGVTEGQQRLFPYGTTRRIESFHARIALPTGWNIAKLPAPVRIQTDSVDIAADWSGAPGAVEQNLRWSPGAAELAPADYAVFERAIRTLRTWLAQPAPLAQTDAVATAAANAPAPDFPLLPTGAGQMRLLDERFPSGERDTERRAALDQVLQWFPDDADTVLTAKIYAALIDHKNDDAALARVIATVLQELGARVPAESRAWARYLGARSRWSADKDPGAIRELRALAEDTALSDYRRSWSALYAARALADTSPQTALDVVAPWDTTGSDARDDILKLEADLLARLDDDRAIRTWAQRLLAAEKESDQLLATALSTLGADKSPHGDTALARFPTVLTPLLQPADRFTAALPHLTRLQSRSERVQRRREFVARLETWLAAHPQPWITAGKSPQFADLPALEKHLDAMNDAHNAEATIDGALQLARFHESDYDTFTKYLYWAAWWLENRQLDLELLAFLAREAHSLPNDTNENVGEIWFKYAAAARAAKDLDAARDEYRAIVQLPTVRPFQRVEANGELALLELAAGNLDAARDAFAACAQEHATHKRGSEFLFVATLLALEQRDWDLALDLVGKIAATKKEYRDATKYTEVMSYLVQSAANPSALRRYWEATAALRTAWDQLVAAHGATPASAGQLPLFTSINELQSKIREAANARDGEAFFTQYDLLVRTGFAVPIYTNNSCGLIPVSKNISPETHQKLTAFFLPVVRAMPVQNDVTYWSARLWEVALLTDIVPSRPDEAASAARKLHAEDGPSDPIKRAALLLWLIASSTSNDEEPIALATSLLRGEKSVTQRAELVAQLSDTLAAHQRTEANVELLLRELDHPDVAANTATHARLKTRLNQLQHDATQATSFTRELNDWLHAHGLDHFHAMPPQSLDRPRYTSPNRDGIYTGGMLPPGEEAKCNLLAALDETKPMPVRFRAFAQFYRIVGSHEPRCDRLVPLAAAAINLSSLPEDTAADIGSSTLAFLLSNGHHAAARQLLEALSNRAIRARLKKNYLPAFAAALAFSDYSPARAKTAFDALLANPVGPYELGLLRSVLSRALHAGDAPLVTELVNGASQVQPAPGFGQSAASIRLELLRHVRRETTLLPFYRRIVEALLAHCPPSEEDRRAAAELTSPLVLPKTFTHRQRATIATAILADDLFPGVNRSSLIYAVGTATSIPGRGTIIGPAIDHLILTAAELDDQALAEWTAASMRLSDYDDPTVKTNLVQDMQAALARPEVKSGTLAQRTIRLRLALIALRTSTEARPDALFGSAIAELMPREMLPEIQFGYLASRQDTAAASALVPTVDADKLSEPDVFVALRSLSPAPLPSDEIALLQASVREKIAQRVPTLWFDTDSHRLLSTMISARELDATELLPDALLERVAAVQADDFDRACAQLARTVRDRDWPAQLRAADAALTLAPAYYSIVLLRGEALLQLGQKERARADFETFLAKALDSAHRPAVLRLLEQCK